MKGTAKPTPVFFAAYPLKAIEKAVGTNPSNEASQSPYLKAILSPKTKTANRARVFPMINPYKDPYQEKSLPVPVSKVPSRVPEDIELIEKRWFHNYE